MREGCRGSDWEAHVKHGHSVPENNVFFCQNKSLTEGRFSKAAPRWSPNRLMAVSDAHVLHFGTTDLKSGCLATSVLWAIIIVYKGHY